MENGNVSMVLQVAIGMIGSFWSVMKFVTTCGSPSVLQGQIVEIPGVGMVYSTLWISRKLPPGSTADPSKLITTAAVKPSG